MVIGVSRAGHFAHFRVVTHSGWRIWISLLNFAQAFAAIL